MLRAFLYKISSKLKKLKTNFEDKTSFIMKMSTSELLNSALEDENNGTKESETLDDDTCLTLQRYNRTCTNPVLRALKRKRPKKRIIRF